MRIHSGERAPSLEEDGTLGKLFEAASHEAFLGDEPRKAFRFSGPRKNLISGSKGPVFGRKPFGSGGARASRERLESVYSAYGF
jgi:hypothetical protein